MLKMVREIVFDTETTGFNAEEGERLVWFGDRLIKTGDLSETTLQWLDWYNGLSEEEQLAISAIPADLLEASGISNAEDTEATSE